MSENDANSSRGKRDAGNNDGVQSKKRKVSTKKQVPEEIPTSAHYQVSFMHRSIVSHVITSLKHGYVVTACRDGIVKFWKRVTTDPDDIAATASKLKQSKNDAPTTPCLEFVKSFTAHVGPVAALCIDPANDTIASIGKEDGFIKLYDVSTFDATAMLKTSFPSSMGSAACFLHDSSKDALLALSNSSNGNIYVYSIATLSLIQTLTLHSKPVTAMAYNAKHKCVVSADSDGFIEVFDCTSGTALNNTDEDVQTVVGARCTIANNQLEYSSNTDLYALAKKKTFALSISMSANYFVVYGADHKVRVYQLTTGKVAVRYDERLDVYEKNMSNYGLDSIEFGKRAATEREMMDHQQQERQQEMILPTSNLAQLDPSERYLLVVTMVGVKLIEWKKNKVIKIIGKADASQLRFLSFCLCLGDAKINQQMQLARSSGSSAAVGDKKKALDSILVALAFEQRRFYVFSHVDPLLEGQDSKKSSDEIARDIWNEPPSAQDRLLGSEGGHVIGGTSQGSACSKAILRTTMGDVHIKLFAEVPKTLENFCGHARSGYYDNVIFHRVIQGFMIQTGDPLGDGTGGESIWGGEFEDEFVRDLRHDRPFTVSMANAGPNTNGSQFFITTVPTPWLDNKHTVFGRVTKGMDICTLIENAKTDKLDKPLDDIRIVSVDLE